MNVGLIIIAAFIAVLGFGVWARQSGAEYEIDEWLQANWKYIVVAIVIILLVYGLFSS